jgi:hypothetical protein
VLCCCPVVLSQLLRATCTSCALGSGWQQPSCCFIQPITLYTRVLPCSVSTLDMPPAQRLCPLSIPCIACMTCIIFSSTSSPPEASVCARSLFLSPVVSCVHTAAGSSVSCLHCFCHLSCCLPGRWHLWNATSPQRSAAV